MGEAGCEGLGDGRKRNRRSRKEKLLPEMPLSSHIILGKDNKERKTLSLSWSLKVKAIPERREGDLAEMPSF